MKRILATTALACAMLFSGAATAEDYPTRPVTIIAPFAPGSGTDTIARVLADELSTKFGQPFIVDNKPGAGGTTGAAAAAQAEPDGYTLMVGGTSSHAASKSMMKHVPYDPVEDFVAIAGLGEFPYFLLVNAKDPYAGLQDLIAAAKARPGELSFGFGNALGRLAGAVMAVQAEIDVTEIAYPSSPPALQDLLGGHISYMFNDMTAALPQVKAGGLRMVAVATPERTTLMPEIPTLAEAGLPFFSISAWSGFFAPAGTPAEITDALKAAVVEISQRDDIRERLAGMGFEFRQDHSAPFVEFVKEDVDRWARFTKVAGIEPQ